METKANYVLVGLFTVIVLILSFGFVYWSANVSDQETQVTMLVRIEGSVTGLSQGSQVLFNGLRVGDVRGLRIDPNNPRVVIATTMVDATTPITPSTRATIGFQGLTGLGFIELKGGDVTERNVIAYAQEQGATPVISADPSDVTDILATAKDIAERANNILTQFESIVDDVGPAVKTTADNISATSGNVKVFTASLADNSDQIDAFLTSVGRLATSANTVAEALPPTIASVRRVVESVDPDSVRTTVDNVAALSQTLRGQSGNVAATLQSISTAAESIGGVGTAIDRNMPSIDRFLANLAPISDTASSVATRLDATLGSADRILASVDPAQLSKTLTDVSAAAANISAVTETIGSQSEAIRRSVSGIAQVVDNVDRITDSVGDNSDAIRQFLGGIGPVSANANRVLASLDDTLGSAGRVIGAVDAGKVAATLDSVSGVAATLNAQRDAIGSTIANLAGTSQNLSALTTTFAGRRGSIDGFLASLSSIGTKTDQALTGLNDTLGSAGRVIGAVDAEKVASAVDSVSGVAATLNAQRDAIGSTIANLSGTSQNLSELTTTFAARRGSIDGFLASLSSIGTKTDQALTGLNDTLGSAGRVIGAVDAGKVAATLDSVSGVAATLNAQRDAIGSTIANLSSSAQNLSELTTAFAARRGSIDGFLASLSSIGTKTDQALTGLNDTLGSAGRVIGAVDAEKVASAVESVSGLAATLNGQRDAIGSTIANLSGASRNISELSGAVLERREAIDGFLTALGPIGANAAEASGKLSTALDGANRVLSGIDQRRLTDAIGNVADITAAVAARTATIQAIVDGTGRAVATLDTTLGGINGTRLKVDEILSGIDPATITAAVENVSSATGNVARAADSIASLSDSVGSRRADIDRIITNATDLTTTLNAASGRVDGVLASLQDLLKSSSTEGLAVEASATLKSIREAAATFQSRVGPIADNVQNFTGNGLQEVRGLVRDVTRSVNRIEGAVTDFQSNPSRLIFGGDEVKQYNGRRRR